MRHMRPLLMLALCGLVTACATPALWEATDPQEFVAVSKNKVNEQELKARGLSYHVDEARGVLYVEKSNLQKTRDYAIRALGVPVTVAVDAATTIVVVGVASYVMFYVDERSLEAIRREREQKEYDALRKTLNDMRREERASRNNGGPGSLEP